MKQIVVIYLFFFSIMFCACSQPTSTAPTFSGTITLDGYGEALDSTYYKVWSDSSWEEFYQDTTINGVTYTTILDAYGNEYFYDSSGYSGLKLYGYDAFVFNAPLHSLPDTIVGNQTYALQTTFSYQGTSYTLTDDETLVDSSTVTVPFGTFTGCPGIQSNTAITSGGQIYLSSNSVYWLAKGPSDIEQESLDFGYTIFMVYGVVNGKGWGVNFSKENLGGVPSSAGMVTAPPRSGTSSDRSTFDMHSLAPMILKGIIPKLRVKKF